MSFKFSLIRCCNHERFVSLPQNFELDPKYNSKLNQDGTQRNGKDSPDDDDEDAEKEAKDEQKDTTDTGQS